jgi:choline dehydrogenase-like flavoprotein
MAALPLVEAGLRVLLLERGRWVDRDASAWDPRAILIDRKYRGDSPYQHGPHLVYPDEAVGGKSVFYGAASFRLREADFALTDRFGGRVPGVSLDWPIAYADLAPHYDRAEQLLGVAGVAGVDPTEPPRATGYATTPPQYSAPAQRVAEAAVALGLHPFPIPLAINFPGGGGRTACARCLTCDQFPCRIGAKNDLSVTILPQAAARGAVVLPNTIALRLTFDGDAVRGVECLDAATGRRFVVRCRTCLVAGGAIASAALLLRSGLAAVAPNGRWIGRCLMRHCSGIVIGLFPWATNPQHVFHKQVAVTDFYFGRPQRAPHGPWGMIQGLQVAPPEFIASQAPFPIGAIGAGTTGNQIYLLCIAHDLPHPGNRVVLDPMRLDAHGIPIARVVHRYRPRDLRARRALYQEAGRLLRQAGAVVRVRKPIDTFSHAVGTCRFGWAPQTAVLDPWCRFFGIRNLFVVDGSFMPSSAGVNPSLTIAANALRVGDYLAETWQRVHDRRRSWAA